MSGNLSNGKQNGTFASVAEQAGIFAGSGGFDITAHGNTNLVGAVIASTADAAKNTLVTGTLTASDIQNHEKWTASQTSLGGGIGNIGANRDGEASQTGASPLPGVNVAGLGTVSATPPIAMSASGGQSGITGSAIAPGTITIASGYAASQQIAVSIGRDTSNANSGALAQEFTDAKRDEIAQGFEAAQILATETQAFFSRKAAQEKAKKDEAEVDQKILNGGVQVGVDGKPLKDGNGNLIPLTDTQRDSLTNNIKTLKDDADALNRTWGAGSPALLITTALNGAAGANVTGSLGALVQTAAVNVLQSLGANQIKSIADSLMLDADGDLKADDPNRNSESVRMALQALNACAGAFASRSGNCGTSAMGAGSSVVLNYLLTEYIDSAPQDGPRSVADQQARTNLVTGIVTAIAGAAGLDASTAQTSARIETQNNDLAFAIRENMTLAEAEASLAKVQKQINEHPGDSEQSRQVEKRLIAYIAIKEAEQTQANQLAQIANGDQGVIQDLHKLPPATQAEMAKSFENLPEGEKANYRSMAQEYAHLSTSGGEMSEQELRLEFALLGGIPSSKAMSMPLAELAAEYTVELSAVVRTSARNPYAIAALLVSAGVTLQFLQPDADIVPPTADTDTNVEPDGPQDPSPNPAKAVLITALAAALEQMWSEPAARKVEPLVLTKIDEQVSVTSDGMPIYRDGSGNFYATGKNGDRVDFGSALPSDRLKQGYTFSGDGAIVGPQGGIYTAIEFSYDGSPTYFSNNMYFVIENGVPRAIGPQASGYVYQGQVLAAAGLDQNNLAITGTLPDGTLQVTIPDGIGAGSAGSLPAGIVEIKFYNATELTASPQILAQMDHAFEMRQNYTLVVGAGTIISDDLSRQMLDAGFNIYVFDPIVNKFSPR